jgi:protein TonB
MPRDLFASTSLSAYPRRRWTLVLSIAAHTSALAAVLALSVASIVEGPQVVSRLHAFVTSATPPVTPPPPPAGAPMPRTTPTPSVTSPPLEAPVGFHAEAPPTPPSADIGVPGGIGALVNTQPLGIGTGSAATLPSAPPTPREIPRVGGEIKAPARITYVAPVYPAIAQAARVEGAVVLDATLDETGAVRDLIVVKSIPLLDRAATDAVSKWRYLPTRLNGVAVPVKMSITVMFTLH